MPPSSAIANSPDQSGDVSLTSLPSQPLHQERSALSLAHFLPSIRKPPRFNGDRTKFREWWSRVTTYLEYYGDGFPSSDQYKINWLGSYLQGIAQSWHLVRDTQMKREGVLDTWAAYSTEFQEVFKDKAEERRNEVKAYKKAVRASKVAAESSKNAAQECEKFKRMMELEWQGDTELYLSELRELNDSMHWSGVVLRKHCHVFGSIPNMMIEWVYTRNWPLPESDDEFLNAVSDVGQSYENLLAVRASIAESEHSEPDQPKVKEPERQRLRSSNPVSRTKESRKSDRVEISTPAEHASQGIDPSANVDCWRCGRESRDSHKTSTSYARKDVYGRELPPSLKRRREVEEEEHERDFYRRWKRSTPP
ncbi:hypothetical protein E4U10_005260 [Claviceps purpurea]|nr:hypothetical protein E4U10_005260 [Claviceps purpurea]